MTTLDAAPAPVRPAGGGAGAPGRTLVVGINAQVDPDHYGGTETNVLSLLRKLGEERREERFVVLAPWRHHRMLRRLLGPAGHPRTWPFAERGRDPRRDGAWARLGDGPGRLARVAAAAYRLYVRATPVRRGRMLGSSWVVPSGNTAMTCRSSSARTAAANVARLSVASPESTRRCTGTAPAKSSSTRAGATDHAATGHRGGEDERRERDESGTEGTARHIGQYATPRPRNWLRRRFARNALP